MLVERTADLMSAARRSLFAFAMLCFTAAVDAADSPRIAVIIDDLGNERAAGLRTARLPGPVACAILPHTPFADVIATEARAIGKEVMLHLPLQAIEEAWNVGDGTISIDATRAQMQRILRANLSSVPNIAGVNTHMGSLLTRHPGHMNWLMAELKSRGDLFFVDSYTTASSVALQMAVEHQVPAVRRHVFLDNDPTRASIEAEFQRLLDLADEQGYAVAIGHPRRSTLDYLDRALPLLPERGYELVSVAAIIEYQGSRSP